MAPATLPQSAYAQCAAYGLVIFDTMMEIIELQKIAATRPLTKFESNKLNKNVIEASMYREAVGKHSNQATIDDHFKAQWEAEEEAEMGETLRQLDAARLAAPRSRGI